MNGNNNLADMMNALSVILGWQNLQENREQSAHNDVQSANDQQARYLLEQIHKEFEEQNKILDKILDKILEL